MLHKQYKLDKENFILYTEECKKVLDLLGLKQSPITFVFEKPPSADDYSLGGSIQYEDSQKLLIYLNKIWPREVTDKKIKYLAAHEIVEILLIQSFLAFAEDCAKTRNVDYDRWEQVVHEALNRLLMLYDPDLMVEIAEDPVFENN